MGTELKKRTVMIMLKMVARGFSPRCILTSLFTSLRSLHIRDANAMHRGRSFHATIFGDHLVGVIRVYGTAEFEENLSRNTEF